MMRSSQPVLYSPFRPLAPHLPPHSEPTQHHSSCHFPYDMDGRPDHFLNRSRSLRSCASGASAHSQLLDVVDYFRLHASVLSGCAPRKKLALP